MITQSIRDLNKYHGLVLVVRTLALFQNTHTHDDKSLAIISLFVSCIVFAFIWAAPRKRQRYRVERERETKKRKNFVCALFRLSNDCNQLWKYSFINGKLIKETNNNNNRRWILCAFELRVWVCAWVCTCVFEERKSIVCLCRFSHSSGLHFHLVERIYVSERRAPNVHVVRVKYKYVYETKSSCDSHKSMCDGIHFESGRMMASLIHLPVLPFDICKCLHYFVFLSIGAGGNR